MNQATELMTLKSNISENMQEMKRLTKRESQVLALLAEGFTKEKIAERLLIAQSTVTSHVRHIYQKLGVSNAHGAISRAFRTGLLS